MLALLIKTLPKQSCTLPERHRGRSADEVVRAESWTLHKIVPEFDKPDKPEDVLHRGIGLDLIDIGVNVPVDEFVTQVQQHRPDILGLSALLTTTMPQMEKVIRTLSKAGMRAILKIMVGGAPVNEKFAIDIGAGGYAVDAGEAVDVAKSLLHIN